MVENINNIKLEIIGLFRSNYLNSFHIREMAKLIGKSHVGLLPHLNAFEKDKILLKKQVGKSNVYSINFDNNFVREYIVLSETKKTLELLNKELYIKKIYDEFINLNLEGCMILFGSYASKTHTKDSDIDLLYIGETDDIEKKKITELGKTYGKEIHLITTSIKQFKDQLLKQSAIIKEVIKNHIILYNTNIFVNEIWRYYNGKKER